MAAKFVVLAFLVAAAQGSAIHGHGADYTSFSYGVSDPHTDRTKEKEKLGAGKTNRIEEPGYGILQVSEEEMDLRHSKNNVFSHW
ncbi:unnamed protein product [Arctia plantaginis]|uniref:Uncharacterized protein n=1 Tax=Arctia plantaginis TaxID=874455 RepID=A0A8S0ZCF3_ARCPL|nr:unnamed protein product [Arctia plantaginis]